MKTVYIILNLVTWQCYVGATVDLTKRWAVHKACLNTRTHHSAQLQRDFDTYGLDALCMLPVDEGDHGVEVAWIEAMRCRENGYNTVTTNWAGEAYQRRCEKIRAGLNDPAKAEQRHETSKRRWAAPGYLEKQQRAQRLRWAIQKSPLLQ